MDTSHLPSSSRLAILPGDLRNLKDVRAFCRGAEGATLYHCAGIVHPQWFVREFDEVNVQGTRNLLQAAEEARVGRVVVLSSNSPIGVNPNREHCFTEESPYHPYMGYGRSKMLMEKIVHEYQARGILETVILRPTWFYGPDQPERQTTFFRMIKNGGAPIVGDGGNLRSMAYIDNLCQAMLLCELSPIANGKTYWVADALPYSMNEIVDTIERLMETEFGIQVAHKRLRLPSVAGEVAGLCDALIQKVGLYQQKIHVLSEMNKTIACSVEKVRQELGYNPLITLEEGMRRSLAWCVENRITI
jgi:nucleoside-diphosphate-sugar epimerase